MKRLAIFASGNGSNAARIITFFRLNGKAQVVCILCNVPKAFVLERAVSMGVPSRVFSREAFLDGEEVISYLQHLQVDGIVLAGFLLKLPSNLIQEYPDRIVNIHPALLPAYGGKGMYGMKVHEAVINNKDKVSGITVHLVNERYDEGKILFQARCEVKMDDTAESLAARIHELEYQYYPAVIASLVETW